MNDELQPLREMAEKWGERWIVDVIDKLRMDVDRLDWLERRVKDDDNVTLGWSKADSEYDEWSGRTLRWPESFWVDDETNVEPPHATLRDAIDAARKP